MSTSSDPAPLTREDLHAVVEAAVATALRGQRDWLRDVVQDALEAAAHDEARREAEYRASLADPRRGYAAADGHA